MAVGAPKYDVGIVYGADATTALQQWLWDISMVTTGTSFGVRYPGVGMMPGGSDVSGPTGLKFKQVAALGEGWREQLSGFYDTASYVEVRRAERALERSMLRPQRGSNASPDAESVQRPLLEPSVDFYGPVALPRGATASGPSKLLASMG
jgi:hypothetical protein